MSQFNRIQNNNKAAKKIAWLICLAIGAFVLQTEDIVDVPDTVKRHLRNDTHYADYINDYTVNPYNSDDLIWTQRNFTINNYHLVFDGKDTFVTYGAKEDYYRGRTVPTNYRIVKALLKHFPDRFASGQPPFQMIYSTADSPHSACIAHPNDCSSDKFAPVIQYGSVPRDVNILPTVIPSILPTFCTFETCKYNIRSRTRPWENMKPQVIWRGSDFSFGRHFGLRWKHNFDAHLKFEEGTDRQGVIDALRKIWDKLTPRWIAVVLSLQASAEAEKSGKLPWIDAKFVDKGSLSPEFKPFEAAGAHVATKEFMGMPEHADYRYHIDIGGGGGTTWGGTLDKLALPGLLFHHETVTKDFFHDRLVPWEHYVPVAMDLSDLKDKFDWAEAHPEEAQNISKAATELVMQIRREANSGTIFNDYFLGPLEAVIKAYQPRDGETFESITKEFEEGGKLPMAQLGKCDRNSCEWRGVKTDWQRIF